MNAITKDEFTELIKKAQFDKNHIDYLKEKIDNGAKLTDYELAGYQKYLSLGGCTSALERSTAQAQHKIWELIQPKIKSLLKRAKQENWQDAYNELYVLFIHKLHQYDPAKGPFIPYFSRHATISILKINTAENISMHHNLIFSLKKAKAGQEVVNKFYKNGTGAQTIEFYKNSENVDFNEFYADKISAEENIELKKDLEDVFSRWIFQCRDCKKSVIFLQTFLDTHDLAHSINLSKISRKKAENHIKVLKAMLKKDYKI